MSTNAFSGVGTIFARSDMASSPAFTAIAEINSIGGPNMTRDTIDVTALDSAGGFREFIAGFKDAGEVVLGMNFSIGGYNDMKTDFESSVLRNYRITLGNTATTQFDFAGLVTALGQAVPLDDKVTLDVTIKISGQVTLTS